MTGEFLVRGARIFDGAGFRDGCAMHISGGHVATIGPVLEAGRADVFDLGGGIVAPGYVDLQVNGGDGIMFNDDPDTATLHRMAQAHGRLGATSILPTLITDTPENTARAVSATIEATQAAEPGILGLHLEGPHLSIARKGAHDPALIRPMENPDLETLIAAAATLPVLKVTLAPESVTVDQVRALADAGVVVSIGHSDCGFDEATAFAEAGATCATHLFNAMSQLGNREPGVVGAALATGSVFAGMIADFVHVHPATVAVALAAKSGPGRIFLVSDAMAVAGSDATDFSLNGRRVTRENGRLTLDDGTLAGADLDLTTAIRNLVSIGLDLGDALAMATSVPGDLIGRRAGRLVEGGPADFVHLSDDLTLAGVWRGGERLR
ncbi:MAG: N-acetylglucosamine-6-phosphate deacetylase [Pseudomonadota bacterium]